MQFSSYDEELSDVQSNEITDGLALRHLDRSGPLGEAIRPLVASKDYLTLSRWNVDYTLDATADQFYNLRCALGCYQKHTGLRLGVDRKAAAFSTFQESEQRCKLSNTIFKEHEAGRFQFRPAVESILHATQRKISRVLGDVPPLGELKLEFGPGATTTVPKKYACASMKLGAVPSCSANMLPAVPELLRESPHMRSQPSDWWIDDDGWLVESVSVEIHPGKLQFAPKNAKTDRCIIVQPTLNGIAQRAYGLFIETQLNRIGQSVHDQTRNQRLAREGSLTGGLATIDLKSASDSISIELMRHLLPWDWFSTLSEIRVTELQYKKQLIKLEQFCSMGNGYTFPLQTLLYWALASSCIEACDLGDGTLDKRVSVYGDDIIMSPAGVPLLAEVLTACGFVLNKDKSYWDGKFRESCGMDFYFGTNIRPFYHRSNFSCEIAFILHNYYVREFDLEMAGVVLETIAPHLRIWGPDGYGDGHLIAPRNFYTGPWYGFPQIPWELGKHYEEQANAWGKPHLRERGWSGYTFETFAWRPKKLRRCLKPGDFIFPIFSIYERDVNAAGPLVVDEYSLSARIIEPSIPVSHTKQGVTVKTIPGQDGFRKIKVYTLAGR